MTIVLENLHFSTFSALGRSLSVGPIGGAHYTLRPGIPLFYIRTRYLKAPEPDLERLNCTSQCEKLGKEASNQRNLSNIGQKSSRNLELHIQKGLPRLSLLATMGKYNFTALRVRQTALRQHAAGKTRAPPKWLDVVADIPPAQVLVRNQAPQHQLVRQRVKTLPGTSKPQVVFEVQEKRIKPKKASRMFLPTEIKYEEDQLRQEFFRDHPWELARPRVLVESTGKDSEHYDWSRLQQPGKRLDGERYVPCDATA